MTDDEEQSSGLKKRFGLWLHRTLIRLRLVGNPRRNKRSQQTSSELGWEERWNVLWIGFRTMLLLFVVTVLIGVIWMVFQPSEQTILIGTLLVLVGYVGVTIWALYQMAKTRREQLQE